MLPNRRGGTSSSPVRHNARTNGSILEHHDYWISQTRRTQMLIDGKELHGLVLKSGHVRFKLVGGALLYVYANCFEVGDGQRVFHELHKENKLLWSLKLNGYVQCHLFSDALTVFDKMPVRGVVEWTTLISGFAESEDMGKKAIELFRMMRKSCEAITNEFTLDRVLGTW